MPNYLDELNSSQRAAVEYIDGASLVIAGAGSGKTRVLTYKIAYLIQQGLAPGEIMALTFTNKAASEMKERICALVGENARFLQMGTFHSVFSRILRREAALIGYDSNFTIYDESDSRSLCKMLVKQLGLDDKVYKPADVHNKISDAKNKLITPKMYQESPNLMARDRENRQPEMWRLFDMYVQNCRKSNAMDFDDLLVNTFNLLHDHEEIQQKYANRFRYILVDEYQDTNYAQQQIVWLLTKDRQRICVVGDDAQSIYGFRGANIDNILDFQSLYEGAKLFKLEQNYRSTQRIVQAANSLIKHNDRQIPKNVFSENSEGEKLQLRLLTSDKEEAINVSKDILRTVRRGEKSYRDFAILYRTNYQSRTFEEQFRKDNIPYRIYGGLSFYQRKEIKDVLAYFRLVVNPHDEEAFRRIINYPTRGIGDTTLNKLIGGAQTYGVSLWDVCLNPAKYGVNLNKGTEAKIIKFRDLIVGFSEKIETTDVYDLGVSIIKESGISEDIYSGHEADDTSRQENLEEFISSMQDFVEGNREEGLPTGLIDFLQEVSLVSDKESEGENEDDGNKVSLMTIHSAKGLEFPVVFVVGMEENIFPSPMCTDSMRLLEEERRLLYVAITRAEERCVLTSAKSRFRYGRMEFDAPSRFLKDIDPKLMSLENDVASSEPSSYRRNPGYGAYKGGYGSGDRYGSGDLRMQNSNPVASQFMADPKPREVAPRRNETPVNPFSSSFERKILESGGNIKKVRDSLSIGTSRSSMLRGSNTPSAIQQQSVGPQPSSSSKQSSASLKPGDRVEHNRFGKGIVKSIEGSGDSEKATIEFVNVGSKQLLLKFAKLTII